MTETETLQWSAVEAMDAAFAGGPSELICTDGAVVRLSVHRWLCDPDLDDHRLFLDHCVGTTLDVGCGPGRLAGALTALAVHAVGIDVSAEAVRQAQVRGAAALRTDVFGDVPGSGAWDHVLLADGNVGIGGDPVRLLRRACELVRPGGTVLAEIGPPGHGVVRDQVRLRVGERTSEPFPWAFLGVDAVGGVARAAGLVVRTVRRFGARRVAVLGRCAATN